MLDMILLKNKAQTFAEKLLQEHNDMIYEFSNKASKMLYFRKIYSCSIYFYQSTIYQVNFNFNNFFIFCIIFLVFNQLYFSLYF